jgi:hypothetical protein
MFAVEADARTYDEISDAAVDLWQKASASWPAWAAAERCVVLVAGWSKKRSRLEMLSIVSTPGGDGDAITDDVIVYAGGPADNSREAIDAFVARFGKGPETFDPRRDGIAFMEDQRRNSLRTFKQGKRPAVGGWVTHSTVRYTGVTMETIHRWPGDRVGHHIELADAGRPELTLSDARKVAEALVGIGQEHQGDHHGPTS